MTTVAIINLIITLVAGLEGQGGDIVRRLLDLAEKRASDVPLTAEELAYLDEQANAATDRLVGSIDDRLKGKA